MTLTASKDDADSLKQVAAMITPLQNKLQIAVQQAGAFAKRKAGWVGVCGPIRNIVPAFASVPNTIKTIFAINELL